MQDRLKKAVVELRKGVSATRRIVIKPCHIVERERDQDQTFNRMRQDPSQKQVASRALPVATVTPAHYGANDLV